MDHRFESTVHEVRTSLAALCLGIWHLIIPHVPACIEGKAGVLRNEAEW